MSCKLSRSAKMLYGSGDTGFSLMVTAIGAYLAIFLTDVAGVSPALVAAAIFIGRTWDYLNDPMVGHLSDRTRTRWGRRRPFLLFGALPFAATYCLLWWRPPLPGRLLPAAYYAAAYVLFDTAATFVYVPYLALTPELTADYDERTSLTSYRMLFSILGSLLAFTVPMLIIGQLRPENADRVLVTAGLFGLASAIPVLVVFLATREKVEHLAAAPPKLLASLKAALRNPPFLYGLGIYLFTWIAVDIMQSVLLYFIKYVVKRESQSSWFMGAIFVAASASLPLWNWVSRRWNKRSAYIAGICFWAGVQTVIITLGPSSAQALFFTLCALAGIGVGAAHVLPWSILPDAVEWDEWKTGERHEGMFYSLVTLAQKAASSIAIPLVLLLLEASGYRPNVLEQPASALLTIRLITGPIPAVLLGLGILCAARYPLNRKRYGEIVRELAARRAKS